MKGLLALKKTAVIATVCMAVLCLPGYSEPTPEQIRERTNLLVAAVDNNNVEQAKVCIKLGADVNATVYYHLHNGHEKYLTTNSNDIHYGNIETYTLLAYAIKYGKSKDIVELLIKAGTDVNAQTYGNTALMSAASAGNKDTVELLIKAGADVNAKTNYDSTALMYAASAGSKDTAEVLIKAGADVNAKDNYYGNAALMYAASAGSKDTAEVLIKAGADVNTKNNYGETALMYAVFAGNKDTVEVLIKAGADVNVKINDGWTALINAAQSGKNDVAEMLIKAGADSGTALIWAIKESHSDAVEFLINAGANVNATDSEGISVLTHAILYGKNDIADLLRTAGAKE